MSNKVLFESKMNRIKCKVEKSKFKNKLIICYN